MGKSSPKPPATPDYTAAAVAQGAANLEAARQTAYMSNPNIYTPLGSQQVTWTRTPQFNEAEYNKAMQEFTQNQALGQGGVQPTREEFTTYIEQPTIRQQLTPEAQQTLEAQQRVERGLAGLGEQALGRVGGIIGTGFAPNLPGLQASYGDFGAVGEAPQITGMGEAGANIRPEALAATPDLLSFGRAGVSAQAQPVSYGPSAGQYGLAGGGPAAGQFGMAGGGPAAPGQIAGANLSTAGQVANAPTVGQFGMAGAGPAGLNLGTPELGAAQGMAGGPAAGLFGFATGFAPAERLQQGVNTAGLANLPVGAGMTGQQAILSRLAPQLQAERSALETQLANQGLVRGGEAYNAAMSAQAQKENDLMTQAALQGIGLDAQMRAQGFSEAQIQAEMANQARQAQFGMGVSQAQLTNQAIAQNFQQALAAQEAQNQAQQQAFGQRLAGAEFGRQGQLQSFQTQQAAQQAYNQAVQQNLAQGLSIQEAQNRAQQQGFQQQLAAGQFGREGQQLAFQMGQQAQESQNRAIAQNFAQSQAAQQAYNQAVQQNFAQGMSASEAYNRASEQVFGQQMGLSQAQNQALAQNQAVAMQQYQAQLARQQQGFGQQMDIQGLMNAALAQRQSAAQQQFQAQMAAQTQRYNQAAAMAQFANQARQQALQEAFALRSQPLNEIAGLMGGSQIAMPQFQGYTGAQVAAAPVFAAQQAAGQFAQQNYANQMAGYNAQMGLLSGLAGAAGTAAGGGFFGKLGG